MQLKAQVRLEGRSGFTSYGTHVRAKQKDNEGKIKMPRVIKQTIMTSVFVFIVCIRTIKMKNMKIQNQTRRTDGLFVNSGFCTTVAMQTPCME